MLSRREEQRPQKTGRGFQLDEMRTTGEQMCNLLAGANSPLWFITNLASWIWTNRSTPKNTFVEFGILNFVIILLKQPHDDLSDRN